MKSTRRSFLSKGAVAAAASILTPNIGFTIMNKGKVSSEIVGHGEFLYRVDKEWGVQDPSKVPINDCHEMVIDSRENIYMTTTGRDINNIIVYNKSGKVLGSWGSEFLGGHGLSIGGTGKDEFLLITDPIANKVFKTDLFGRVIQIIERPKEVSEYEIDDQFKPTETAIMPNGDFYVADGYGKNFIIQYNFKGEYIRHFGGEGEEDDKFSCCHGITLDTRDSQNPTLLITSRGNQQFKRFALDGNHIETISLPGCSICRPVLHGKNLFFPVIVTESWWSYDGMLAILNSENKVVSFPGGSAPTYSNGILEKPKYDEKTFLNPHDILVDSDENLYVPQWYSGKSYPIKLHRI